jgi:RNA ligase (TIGR02306 family)
MSDTQVTLQTISSIVPCPNADSLEIATILGAQTVVTKGKFKAGDAVVYFPPDICLPADVAKSLGVSNYLKGGGRVSACRIRGTPSYGFVIPVSPEFDAKYDIGRDVSADYSAVKHEPPVKHPNLPGIRGTGEVWGGRAPEPVNFRRYTDIQHYWNHHAEFPEGMPVRVTEKIHGTNSRIALLKVDDEWNFHAGSHYTARRQFEPNGNESVYWRPLENEGVLAMLTHLCNIDTTHPGPNHRCWLENDAPTNDVILYGELYGPVAGQDLDYGIPAGEIGWRCYDCSVNGRYLDWDRLHAACLYFAIPMVPLIYVGPFRADLVQEWTNGPSIVPTAADIRSKFKGREGCVITPLTEVYSRALGRLILKSVSADYRARKGAKDEGEV